jgi:hypothetical protein
MKRLVDRLTLQSIIIKNPHNQPLIPENSFSYKLFEENLIAYKIPQLPIEIYDMQHVIYTFDTVFILKHVTSLVYMPIFGLDKNVQNMLILVFLLNFYYK